MNFILFCVYISIAMFIGGIIISVLWAILVGGLAGVFGLGSWIAKQFTKN